MGEADVLDEGCVGSNGGCSSEWLRRRYSGSEMGRGWGCGSVSSLHGTAPARC